MYASREPVESSGEHLISIIIPNRNGGQTIGTCLGAIYAFDDARREVIVVDDCSEDGSQDIIRKFPCRLIQLQRHAGAGAARNAGARSGRGDILFFIDDDCILQEDTLSIVRKRLSGRPTDTLLGGTYTPAPYDKGLYNRFQSVFVNHFETRKSVNPDYLATHALAIHAETFRRTGGFTENFFLPILEDIDFSHRMRRAGYRLIMDPDLQVSHIFNFTLLGSLHNAARKTRYWIVYSLMNKDLFADSGTASREIKINGAAWMATALLSLGYLATGQRWLLAPLPLLWGVNIFVSRHLFKAFYKAGSAFFAFMAGVYYTMIYPAAVWTGFFRGVIQYLVMNKQQPPQGDARRSSSSDSARE